MQQNFDAIVVGHGPAGCSAALYLCRAGLSVAVVGRDHGSLANAEKIENYYGLDHPMRGKDLVRAGRRQCSALGADVRKDEVLALNWQDDGSYKVTLAGGDTLTARAALLATGRAKRAPDIAGLSDFEGRGVSYCAVCDAFLYRERNVAVLGCGPYAQHEMQALLPLAGQTTLITHGGEPEFEVPEQVAMQNAKLISLGGNSKLEHAQLDNGETLALDGLFVALGQATAADLAKKLGLKLNDGAIPVGDEQETTLPGLFAAGDCTGTFPQVAFAVAEGAKAALSMIEYLRELNKKPPA